MGNRKDTKMQERMSEREARNEAQEGITQDIDKKENRK
jgi:hypothetical protein